MRIDKVPSRVVIDGYADDGVTVRRFDSGRRVYGLRVFDDAGKRIGKVTWEVDAANETPDYLRDREVNARDMATARFGDLRHKEVSHG